jgi:UDP-N-acetyl-D-glucosamine dehydrogenase
MINVVIQGLGYVGAASALVIASKLGKNKKPLFNIIGIERKNNDNSQKLIDKINSKIFPHSSSDVEVDSILKKIKKFKNLIATDDIKYFSKADVIISSINFDFKDKNFNDFKLIPFRKSIEEIGKYITENTLLIVQSTVPPGTTEQIVLPILRNILRKRQVNFKKIFLAHSFERVMPGDKYMESITNNWRVYAGINKVSENKCKNFLSKIINVKEYPLTRLNNPTESEICKLLENSFRAVNIAFIDEWLRFTEKLNLNLFDIINAIRKRPSHKNIMLPGLGVGGYCIPKDPLIAKVAAEKIFKFKDLKFPMSVKAASINKKMPDFTFDKIKKICKKQKINKILLMGVSYKHNVGDTRNSAVERLFKKLKASKFNIFLHDPSIEMWKETNKIVDTKIPDVKLIQLMVFLVKHKEFNYINFEKLKKRNKNLFIIDANNVLSKKQILKINKLNIKNYLLGK